MDRGYARVRNFKGDRGELCGWSSSLCLPQRPNANVPGAGARPTGTAAGSTRARSRQPHFPTALTSLPTTAVAGGDCVDCDCWQVEIGFKRLKTLGGLDELPSADPVLARTWLLAQLIAAVLTDDLADEIAGFPPSSGRSATCAANTLAPLGEGKGTSCSAPFCPGQTCARARRWLSFADASQRHQGAGSCRHASSGHRNFARMGLCPWPSVITRTGI